MNSTNRKMLRKLYRGTSADVLVGKKIQLYLESGVRDPSSGEKVDGIRIRNRIPTAVKAEPVKCADCGQLIAAVGTYSAEDIANINYKRFGRKICAACSKKLSESKQETTEPEPPKTSSLADELKADMEG